VRGGVLEAEGMVEIKFRKPDLLATMHRIDPRLKARLVCTASTCVLPHTHSKHSMIRRRLQACLTAPTCGNAFWI